MVYPKNKRPVHPGAPELSVRPGGENRTPAPINFPSTTADQARSTSWGRSGSKATDNPGANGYGGPSSLNPGERAAAATINAGASTDVVLEGLIRDGAHGQPDWQTRDLTSAHDNPHGRVPTHDAMKGPAPAGTVPARTGTPAFDPSGVRKP